MQDRVDTVLLWFAAMLVFFGLALLSWPAAAQYGPPYWVRGNSGYRGIPYYRYYGRRYERRYYVPRYEAPPRWGPCGPYGCR
jgi:hypothetical protein